MPPWNHMHPLIIHFPIALLLFAPLLVLLGLLWPDQRQGIHGAALVTLVLGEVSALAALVSGNAASSLAQRTPALRLALAAHEHYAQLTVLTYALLTLAFALLWGLPRLAPRARGSAPLTILLGFWLAFSTVGMAALVQTGHLGGHMVHDLGTHPAPIQEPR